MKTAVLQEPLNPGAAFVVQVRRLRGGFSRCLSGRVEHVISGSASSFGSMGELGAFIERTLASNGGSAKSGC